MLLISVSNSKPYFTIALNYKYVLINVAVFIFVDYLQVDVIRGGFVVPVLVSSVIYTVDKSTMGQLSILTIRMAVLLLLHAAGAGLASPTVLVTRPVARITTERLPADNQTFYRLEEGESRNLELNTSTKAQMPVFITVSPCTRDIRWAVYHGKARKIDGPLTLLRENNNGEMTTLSLFISSQERYMLQLSSLRGGTVAVSVSGEAPRMVRMRLRVRSRRRLTANWDPSPIDPQSTTYCVVASHTRNYTSLCAAQFDAKANRLDSRSTRFNPELDRVNFEIEGLTSPTDRKNQTNRFASAEVDNKIEVDTEINPSFGIYEGNFKSYYRRKKFGRSTKINNEDPVIACVGERTHHLIENLDPSRTYFVSVFGIARDRRAGTLLATNSVRPRTSTAKRLKENVPYRSDIKSKTVYYFKATIEISGGLWLTVSTCGGAVDIEVSVRGKKLYTAKTIEHSKFFVPVSIPNSSIQETSDEGSVQFDSSSEEARMRYVIKVVPSKWDRDGSVNVEIAASTTRWGVNNPELTEDGAIVRELRPKRSCRSIDIAFLPATHNATDVIRYCIFVKESVNGELYTTTCTASKRSYVKVQCVNHIQLSQTKVIMQKINGLKPGRKYAIQVTAANKGSSVPYNVLYADTNVSCRDEQ